MLVGVRHFVRGSVTDLVITSNVGVNYHVTLLRRTARLGNRRAIVGRYSLGLVSIKHRGRYRTGQFETEQPGPRRHLRLQVDRLWGHRHFQNLYLLGVNLRNMVLQSGPSRTVYVSSGVAKVRRAQ